MTETGSCAELNAGDELIDIAPEVIFMVDSSPSMSEAHTAIEQEFNSSLAATLDESGLDYSVIMMTEPERVTIGPPLSESGRLTYIDVGIGSSDDGGLQRFLLRIDEIKELTRENTNKVVMMLTDSSGGSGGENIEGFEGRTFDEILYEDHSDYFGTENDSRLRFHAIVGLSAKTSDPSEPYASTEPIQESVCTTASLPNIGHGPGFQGIAKRTEGLRFPVCNFENYDVMFRTIADDALTNLATQCNFPVPDLPGTREFTLENITFAYHPSPDEEAVIFEQVAEESDCGGEQFYIDEMEVVRLCPDACEEVREGESQRLLARFPCSSLIPLPSSTDPIPIEVTNPQGQTATYRVRTVSRGEESATQGQCQTLRLQLIIEEGSCGSTSFEL